MRGKAFLGALVLVVSACTLLTHFEPDGQPCDPGQTDPYLQCLSDAGYSCVAGFCRQTGGVHPDGGLKDSGEDLMDSGSDAGLDAGRDAGVDAGLDAGLDAGKMDAGKPDAGKDSGM